MANLPPGIQTIPTGFSPAGTIDLKRTHTSREIQRNSKEDADADGIHGRMIPPRSCGDQLAIPRLAIFIPLDYAFSPAGRLA